ncbi:MAG: hypothetical protein QME75_12380 [Deltaproteobacteria bacterium]|nr:hypothetical protein [Deltaproteobacteria bacterium]
MFDPDEEFFGDDEAPQSLEVTWHLFDEPDIPNVLERAGDGLEEMFERFGVRPVQVDGQERLFEARYELPKFGGTPRYPEAAADGEMGFMDFLSGFPYGEAEIMAVVREESTCPLKVDSQEAQEDAVPPVPLDFFAGFPEGDVLHNYLAVPEDGVEHLAEGLPGEPEPELLWWLRQGLKLEDGQTWPVPGEFAALAVRLFPGKYWGEQKTSPFLFSGNWLDTLYYTSAIVEEVLEPDETRPYPLYKVKWRKAGDGGNLHLARPSGFEIYEAGERVAVLKDAATERQSQTWKDDQEWDEKVWRLAPVTFYEVQG